MRGRKNEGVHVLLVGGGIICAKIELTCGVQMFQVESEKRHELGNYEYKLTNVVLL
jgi:hypothetical protein